MLNTQGATPGAAIESLLDQLLQLRAETVQESAARLQPFGADFPGGRFNASALNLAQYLALRRRDLRPLQEQLAALGLSSLGRGEAHILDNLNRVIEILAHSLGLPPCNDTQTPPAISGSEGRQQLDRHAEQVFSHAPAGRTVRIMVTLPASAASDSTLLQGLLAKGMNCARINCAHDDSTVWSRMIANLRSAEQATGRTCRILMDLGGQKIRTGPIESLPGVLHLKPGRDRFGAITEPARVQLLPDDMTAGTADCLRLPRSLQAQLQAGDRFSFMDTRGKRRYLDIAEITAAGSVFGHCWRSTWLCADTRLAWQRPNAGGHFRTLRYTHFAALPETPGEIRLAVGDQLLLMNTDQPGRAARTEADGRVLEPGSLGCSHPSIVAQLKPGHEVWLDDGKVGARVESVDAQGARLRITHAGHKGTAIRADKGINLPDLALDIPALTEMDLHDLDFIVGHADAVGYSFVQSAADMRQLIQELDRRGAADLPIIAKIETKRAVSNLPCIILSSIGQHPLGVMIARGDLAVEIGSARLAEIQEEILWLCEAAHVPVVWATQVLETMAKKGIRSRPELTDAAMGVRAECVMLNKGPYILDALVVLDSILTRMEAHQRKKHSRLRALHW